MAARPRYGLEVRPAAGLETHLSTLSPPVRLRGYLEARYLDMAAYEQLLAERGKETA